MVKQLYVAVLSGQLGILSVGQFYGWASPILPKLIYNKDADYPVHLTIDEASWIVSLFSLGASMGAIISAIIVNIIGRKITILIASVPSIIGWLLIIFATSPWELYISRLISGISVGIAYTSTPIYLGEISPSRIRGNVVTMIGVAAIIGILIQYTIGPFLSVRNLAYVSLVAPCLFGITFIWVPESPYFLMRRKTKQEAIKSLVRLRGTKDVHEEMDSIERSVEENLAIKSSFRDLLIPSNRRIIMVMICLSIVQEASGTTAIMSYSETIFDEAHTALEGKYLTMMVGVVQLISTTVCMSVADRFGRKLLLITSGIGIMCTTGVVATYFTLQHYHVNTSDFTWLTAVGVLSFIVAHALGFTSIVYTLCGEVFPMNIKASGSMIMLLTAALTEFVMTKLHAVLQEGVGMHVPMWIYSMSGLFGALVTYFYLPETKGKTLEEIQEKFAKLSKK